VNCDRISVYNQSLLALPGPLLGFFRGIKKIEALAETNASTSKSKEDLGTIMPPFAIIRPKNTRIAAKK
jgi:hypothetical protein